jgi:general secretion pathway protein J
MNTVRSLRGFTLLELLIAVAIFAVVGVMAYGGLQAVLGQQVIARDAAERFREVQFAVQQVARDFQQTHPRPVRETLGDGYRNALRADLRSSYPIEFTRGGWSNPLGQPRAAVQRVAYRLDEDRLVRLHWFVPDQTLAEEPVERELLAGVREFRLRFLGPGGWSDDWPPGLSGEDPATLPFAVEFVLALEDLGEIRRLVELPN